MILTVNSYTFQKLLLPVEDCIVSMFYDKNKMRKRFAVKTCFPFLESLPLK